MMLSSSRISHQLREYNNTSTGCQFGISTLYTKHPSFTPKYQSHLSSSTTCSFPWRFSLSSSKTTFRFGPNRSCSSFSPLASNNQDHPASCLSIAGKGQDPASERLSPVAGGIVALGKFEALHIGHRELAIQAAKIGVPYLLSFIGMAEILGWEPRPPIVAQCDRKRVLSSWAPLCSNVIPKEFQVEFSKVRNLTPQQFVEKLSHELGVLGVVAGENYRFGYKAAGNASDLLRLCEDYDMRAYIIDSVMDKNQESRDMSSNNSKEAGQVSSTRVRHALANGEMKYVSELLGRPHRLILDVKNNEMVLRDKNLLSSSRSCLLNLPPKDGCYGNCCLFIDGENMIPCRVVIDTREIHLELNCLDPRINIDVRSSELLSIEFLDSVK